MSINLKVVFALMVVIVNFAQFYGQSHNLILGTYVPTKSEPIFTQIIHKENTGWLSSFKKVEKILKFPSVSVVY